MVRLLQECECQIPIASLYFPDSTNSDSIFGRTGNKTLMYYKFFLIYEKGIKQIDFPLRLLSGRDGVKVREHVKYLLILTYAILFYR